MNTSHEFKEFLVNIKINENQANTISYRYGRITVTTTDSGLK
ncbi:hypothetical protein CHRY9293_03495 [Chryseobacterium potabilaquae]|uniref:Uncharacterized protein n=1 Tax=Chryseobacterium potabilaquae TaxID=2675057 RepID=A0A6N4X8K5_9FLAO|nr:hypothetical protein CHRY9293_03495 [Chryseobacterium potabilaquae]